MAGYRAVAKDRHGSGHASLPDHAVQQYGLRSLGIADVVLAWSQMGQLGMDRQCAVSGDRFWLAGDRQEFRLRINPVDRTSGQSWRYDQYQRSRRRYPSHQRPCHRNRAERSLDRNSTELASDLTE